MLVGLALLDEHSYLAQAPAWTPTLPFAGDTFRMSDLVRFADANA